MKRNTLLLAAVAVFFAQTLWADEKFVPMDLPQEPTGYTLSEDGKLLLVVHEQANQVTVWDVQTAKLLKTLDVPAPREALCRGEHVFVASYSDGNVLQYSVADWKLLNKFPVGKQITSISAGTGTFYTGKIVVTCEKIKSAFLLDVPTGKMRTLEREKFYLSDVRMAFSGAMVLSSGARVQLEKFNEPEGQDPIQITFNHAPAVGDAPGIIRNSATCGQWDRHDGYDALTDNIGPLAYRYDHRVLRPCLPGPKAVPLEPSCKLELNQQNYTGILKMPARVHQAGSYQVVTVGGQTYLFFLGPMGQSKPLPNDEGKPTLFRAVVKAFPVPDLPWFDLWAGLPPADSMDLTEDGQFLLVSHTGQNKITVFDVKTSRVAASIGCKSPGPILSRGQKAYVANQRRGTVTIIDSKQWQCQDEMKFSSESPTVLQMHAGRAEAFDGKLMIKIEGDSLKCWYELDTIKDKAAQRPYFGMGPSRKQTLALDSGMIEAKPGIWIGDHVMRCGQELQVTRHDQDWLIPVRGTEIVAGVGAEGVSWYKLDTSLTPMGQTQAVVPGRAIAGSNGAELDRAVATRQEGNACIFIRHPDIRVIFHCVLPLPKQSEPSRWPENEWFTIPADEVSGLGIADGGYLVLAHEKANRLSIYEALSGELVKTIPCPSPAGVLCRGSKVYIPSSGKGTINVLSIPDWKMLDEVSTGMKEVHYLSAPLAGRFKNEILAVNDNGGGSLVDVENEKHRLIPKLRELATFDSTGKYLLHGQRVVVPLDYVLKSPENDPAYSGGNGAFLQQVPGSDYWFGPRDLLAREGGKEGTGGPAQMHGGYTLSPVKLPESSPADWTQRILVPDISGQRFYMVTPTSISSLRLDLSLTLERLRNVERKFHLPIIPPRHAAPMLGISKDDRVSLFVSDASTGRVYCFRGDLPAPDQSDPAYKVADGTVPGKAVLGKKLQFKLPGAAKGKRFTLVRGPEGASLSEDGTVVWTPARTGTQEFKIRVEVGENTTFDRYQVEVTSGQVGGSVVVDAKPGRIPLAPGPCRIAYSYDGANMILLNGKEISVLDADGRTVLAQGRTEEDYLKLQDRKEYYVALSRTSLDLLDKKSLKPVKSIALDQAAGDLAIHPLEKTSFVAVADASAKNVVASKRVLQVDESSGKSKLLPKVYGQFLAADAQGHYLYVGLEAVYQSGYAVDWYYGEVSPTFGSVAVMACYDISGEGVRFAGANLSPAVNVSGMRPSFDGKTVAIAALRADDRQDVPSYRAGNLKELLAVYRPGHSVTDVAIHPMLPIVAVAGEKEVQLFDGGSGKELSNKLNTPEQLTEVHAACFAPSGRYLLIQTRDSQDRQILLAAEMSLDRAELATVAEGLPHRGSGPAAGSEVAAMPEEGPLAIEDIQSLSIAAGAKELTPKEIGRKYLDSVVLVESALGSGTGFFVGEKGYVLTCAHVLSRLGDPIVSCRQTQGANVKTSKGLARVVFMDKEKDLALLQVAVPGKPPLAPLAARYAVESGDKVVVIGHPGLGQKTLNYTMTTGVVSNPRQTIERQEYLQTNAAVNPGSSGGPIFDAQGNVIALVVLKGDIEGAGFAVPSDRLVAFLHAAVEAKAKRSSNKEK